MNTSTQIATAGNFQLTWSWPKATADTHYLLFEKVIKPVSNATEYIKLYEGKDMASVLSGKPDGIYKYSVKAISTDGTEQAHSNKITVEVAHHSLSDALLVFSLGAAIFVALLIVILRGIRQTAN